MLCVSTGAVPTGLARLSRSEPGTAVPGFNIPPLRGSSDAQKSLRPQDRLRRRHVLVFVVNADHDYMFGRGVFGGIERNLEVILVSLRVGDLPDRFHILPIGGVDGKFRALDGGETVLGAKVHM